MLNIRFKPFLNTRKKVFIEKFNAPYGHLKGLQLSNSTGLNDMSKGRTVQAKELINVSHGQGNLVRLMTKMQS